MPLSKDDEAFVAEVSAAFRQLLVGNGARVTRGSVLWDQFEELIDLRAGGARNEATIVEKVNEMAVASELAADGHLVGSITYEPDLLPSGRRIDFLAERQHDVVHVEVKTVRPLSGDEASNWSAYHVRSRHHPENVQYIVGGDFPGTLYTNAFRSRAKFLEYSLDFEQRLAEAKTVNAGPGVLVFCGTGFQWTLDELEDFVDFYSDGVHRIDDAFSTMEEHSFQSKRIRLLRNIDQFAFLKRPAYVALRTEFKAHVRGPSWGRGLASARDFKVPPQPLKRS